MCLRVPIDANVWTQVIAAWTLHTFRHRAVFVRFCMYRCPTSLYGTAMYHCRCIFQCICATCTTALLRTAFVNGAITCPLTLQWPFFDNCQCNPCTTVAVVVQRQLRCMTALPRTLDTVADVTPCSTVQSTYVIDYCRCHCQPTSVNQRVWQH